MTPPFATFIIDRDPYTFADLGGLAQAYLEDAGGFLFVALLVYFLITLLRPSQQHADDRKVSGLMLGCVAAAILCYAGYGFCVITSKGADRQNLKPPPDPTGYVKTTAPRFSLLGYGHRELPTYVAPILVEKDKEAVEKGLSVRQPYPWQALFLTAGGLFALVGAAAPFAVGVRKLRVRRVWAITKLTLKEVVRNRVFLAFLLVLVPVMLPLNWFIPFKPGDELKIGVQFVGIIVAVVLLLAALLLAAFALPNDVKNQNIYTIVTKPVERFEIVLGRFLGYTALFTAAAAAVATFTLLTLSLSKPSAEAQARTQTARVPVRGKVSFQSRRPVTEGIDVGREFNYRKYIGGDTSSSMRGVYEFRTAPAVDRGQDKLDVEFTFDIYRLTKGEENRGVDVNVRVVSWRCEQKKPPEDDPKVAEWQWADGKARQKYLEEAVAELKKVPGFADLDAGNLGTQKAENALRNATPDTPDVWAVANTLADKYGFYEFYGKEVYDQRTEKLTVPAGVFRNAAANEADGQKAGDRPRVKVYVHCTTPSQMLGMADGDLYLLEQEKSFAQNYLKSVVGLWCWLVLVIGLCVTLSTYLDAVVTLLCVLFLFGMGFFGGFIQEQGQSIGKGTAGPFAALNQLLQAKGPTALQEGTAVEKAADTLDLGSGWGFRRLINVLPDVEAFYWTKHVAEGFNVNTEYLILNLILLAAYLFPWFLLSYYLLRGREVAA